MPKPNFTHAEFYQASQHYATNASIFIDAAIRRAYHALTPEERVQFATHDGEQSVNRLVRQLLVNTAEAALNAQFNAPEYQEKKSKLARILRRR